jgi:hypothetical protein
MGDKIIITDEKPAPAVIVVAPETKTKVEKVVTEKTTVVESKED